MLPWQRHMHHLNYQKFEVCVVNLLVAIFGNQRIKGFREKGTVNETEVSKRVFSHLKSLSRSYGFFCDHDNEVFLNPGTQMGLEKLPINFENVDVDIRDSTTVCIIYLLPQGSQFNLLFTFLLHNELVLIGFKSHFHVICS